MWCLCIYITCFKVARSCAQHKPGLGAESVAIEMSHLKCGLHSVAAIGLEPLRIVAAAPRCSLSIRHGGFSRIIALLNAKNSSTGSESCSSSSSSSSSSCLPRVLSLDAEGQAVSTPQRPPARGDRDSGLARPEGCSRQLYGEEGSKGGSLQLCTCSHQGTHAHESGA